MQAVRVLGEAAPDVDECRRLAELFHLDTVGIVRSEDGHRRVSWWSSPGAQHVPADVLEIVGGGSPDWITVSRGTDLVMAHLPAGSERRSKVTITALLQRLAAQDLGDPAAEDPMDGERTRLAYAIHDGLTQVVTAAVIELEWLARRAELEPGEAVDALSVAATEMRKALEEIRGMLATLSPEDPNARQGLDDLVQGVMERWQLPATWSVEGDLRSASRPVLAAAASVIRESVANAAKHSATRDVDVRVKATRTVVEVRVEDRGRGFDPETTDPAAGHLGLAMMRRRVAEVNGTLDIESEPGRWTRVVARLPVASQGDEP